MATQTQYPPISADGLQSRRRFLSRLWAALGLLALVEFIAAGLFFFRRDPSKPDTEDAGTRIACGAVADYAPGSVTAFINGRFYLVRLADGGLLAISRQCTHLGCTVPWVEDEKRFVCPCHASAFDITGAVIQSPASRALDLYPLHIENQTITVDTGKPIRRSEFNQNQVVYPKTS